jgi:hypothetical protein
MSKRHFNINRPVHLARRNVFYERAVELLFMPMRQHDAVLRLDHLEQIARLLKTSEQNAFFAMRAGDCGIQEENFLRFLKLISDNVRSAHAMVAHEIQLRTDGGFLSEFLSVTADETVLPAQHYLRRAEDILQGLWHVLRLAQLSYRNLLTENETTFSEAERNRYQKAADSFREEVMDAYHPPIEGPADSTHTV